MKYLYLGAVVSALLLTVTPVLAHHSFAAEFDINKPFSGKGTVARIDWVNAHVALYLDTTDGGGRVTRWRLETFAPANLHRAGFSRDTLGLGKAVTVNAYAARDGSNVAFLRDMTFEDGHTIELWLGDPGSAP